MKLAADDALAIELTRAIREGDIAALQTRVVSPEHANARIVAPNGHERSLLHVATDWPGHVPRVAETIALLAAAGADLDAPFGGPHRETPLHWAASSDDVAAIDALLAAGATLDASGGIIGHGTPLDDAVAFGQWAAARRLLERGARTRLWTEAALGLVDRVTARLDRDPEPLACDVTNAFWCACHGGQRATAELLANAGADLDWIGYDELAPLDAAERSGAHELVAWLRVRGARSAKAIRRA